MKLLYCIIGVLIPFFGTILGSILVLFLKEDILKKYNKIIFGFSSGIMIAASIWSLIIPSIEISNIFNVSLGLIVGLLFLIFICNKKIDRISFSIILHNIPEGMAVGVSFASFLSGNIISLLSAFILSIGIAIQNIPEGLIVALPLRLKGVSKFKSFVFGMLSGIVEPIAALITIIFIEFAEPLLPFLLAFAAGAMIYVVINDLIPEMNRKKNNIGIIGFFIGFILMMSLDVLF